jgi:hypothetical protein
MHIKYSDQIGILSRLPQTPGSQIILLPQPSEWWDTGVCHHSGLINLLSISEAVILREIILAKPNIISAKATFWSNMVMKHSVMTEICFIMDSETETRENRGTNHIFCSFLEINLY